MIMKNLVAVYNPGENISAPPHYSYSCSIREAFGSSPEWWPLKNNFLPFPDSSSPSDSNTDDQREKSEVNTLQAAMMKAQILKKED